MMAKTKADTLPAEDWHRQSISTRSRVSDLARRTGALADEGDSINALRVIEAETAKWDEAVDALRSALANAKVTLAPRRDAAGEELSDTLRRSLESAGRQVFGESSTLVIDGIVHVDLNVKRGKAKINGVECRDLRVDGLTQAIVTAADNLHKHTAPAEDFGDELLRAYEQLTSVQGASFGSQVKTLDLLPLVALGRQDSRFRADPLASQFKDYPLALYRADLHGLLAQAEVTIAGSRFGWSSGASTEGAVFMYVPALRRTAHVGRVWFDNVEEEAGRV